ncbi:MAG: hypothetical protein PHF51_03490 [Candidatus ainarchaeum sp.]|nr:hypothetical protein [Candidatus ainarchaeum sp.]
MATKTSQKPRLLFEGGEMTGARGFPEGEMRVFMAAGHCPREAPGKPRQFFVVVDTRPGSAPGQAEEIGVNPLYGPRFENRGRFKAYLCEEAGEGEGRRRADATELVAEKYYVGKHDFTVLVGEKDSKSRQKIVIPRAKNPPPALITVLIREGCSGICQFTTTPLKELAVPAEPGPKQAAKAVKPLE